MARVLVVDDSLEWCKAMALVLGNAGHSVTQAGSVSAAVATLRSTSQDVVITDLQLGEGSGLEVLGACSAQEPVVPAIVLSGVPRDELRALSGDSAVPAFSKFDDPVVLVGTLLAAIAEAVDRH